MPKDRYESPLASRYASDFMLCLFSPDTRFQTWRRLWVALARAEHNLGLPITAEQVAELEAHITDIDYETASAREKEVRHDVMAHVYTYGKAAPSATGSSTWGPPAAMSPTTRISSSTGRACGISGESCWLWWRTSVNLQSNTRPPPPWAIPTISPPSW